MYEDQLLPSVAFVMPLCLIGATALILVVWMVGKWSMARGLEWGDGLLFVNFLFAGILNVSGSLLTLFGLGKHMDQVDKETLVVFTKVAIIVGISYSLSVTASKALLADYYLRIAGRRRHSQRHVLKGVFLSLLVLQLAEEIAVNLLSCQPGAHEGTLVRLGGRCLHQRASWLTGLTLNMCYAIVLPLVHPAASLCGWSEWPQEPLRRKMGRVLSFLGLTILFVATVGRAVTVIRIGSDITYDYALGIIWSSAEADAFVVCLCLPSWRQRERAGSSSEDKTRPKEAATTKPPGSPRESIGPSCQSPVPAEGGARGEEEGEGEVDEPAPPPGGLVPTAEERVDWVETMQSFPTEGRPQVRMISSQMGTTSYAEAVPPPVPGRGAGAPRKRMAGLRGRGGGREEQASGEPRKGGILVVTEVRREVVQDPDFPWTCEVGSEGEAEARGDGEAEAEGEAEAALAAAAAAAAAAGRRGQAVTALSLDKLPSPLREGGGMLDTCDN